MADHDTNSLADILQRCAAASPDPWYPLVWVRGKDVDRSVLDARLDQLRLGGLVELTEWVQGSGQGYRPTPEGQRILHSPRHLRLLAGGKVPDIAEIENEPEDLPAVQEGSLDRLETVRAVFEAPGPSRITVILILANLGIFFWGYSLASDLGKSQEYTSGFTIDPNLFDAVYRRIGALTGIDLVEGRWWKLLSACFVHFGLLHLLINMFTLWVMGPTVEQMWGSWRFLYIYLVSGLGGSCAMVLVHPDVGGAGASGALWGVMTSYVAWIFLNRRYLPGPLSASWLRNMVGVFFLNIFISMMPGISASAHFGGGGVGIAAAILANSQRFGPGFPGRLSLLGMLLLPPLCLASVVWGMADDPRWHSLEVVSFETHLSVVDSTLRNPLKVYDDSVADLIDNYHPDRRDPEAVKKARAAIGRERDKLAAVGKVVDSLGPYRNPHVSRAQHAAGEVVAAAEQFYSQAERCLAGEGNRRDAEKKLADDRRQLQDRVTQWRVLRRGLHRH